MSDFWQGFLSALGAIGGLVVIVAAVFTLISVFGRSQQVTRYCGFCKEVSYECPSIWLEWTRGMKLTRHMKREHKTERDDWRTDFAEGGIALAQDRKRDRRAGRAPRDLEVPQ